MILHNFIILLGTGIILSNLIIALKYWGAIKEPNLKYIIVYIFLGLLISINTIVQVMIPKILSSKQHIIIFDILYLIQGLIIFAFFQQILKSKILILFLYIFLFSQAYILIKQFNTEIRVDINIYSTPVFIAISILYFKNLLQKKPIQKLTKTSEFWIVVGIFFWSCVSFPIYSLYPFIKANPKYINISLQIFSLSNIALIVMYTFFIKSFLCLKHPQITT